MKIGTRSAITALALASVVLAGSAHAGDPAEAGSVSEAVERISARLERQGFQIETVINHAAAADSVGLDLPPTQVVFFGNDRQDASLIRRRQTSALDLPLRFLVYEDDEGEIQTSTNDIGFLIDRHEVPVFDFRLLLLDQVLDQFGLADNGVRSVKSTRGFDETVEALLDELTARGFRIPLTIDYSERARWLRPTRIVLFGNPNVGTPLMQSQRGIALDLPQKMLVYEDRHGRVKLAYNDPSFLARKHDVIDQDPRLGNIANALRSIAEAAAGSN